MSANPSPLKSPVRGQLVFQSSFTTSGPSKYKLSAAKALAVRTRKASERMGRRNEGLLSSFDGFGKHAEQKGAGLGISAADDGAEVLFEHLI